MSDPDALARSLRGEIADARVLAALAAVPRHPFVPDEQRERAYENVALPLPCGQSISQPLVVARMLELLELSPADRVLDVGTGSGYHAALLAWLGGEVWTIERHPELAARARVALDELELGNLHCVTGDGSLGLPEQAPFDAINVAAAAAVAPARLVAQLAPGGRLVAPLGRRRQHLTRIRRDAAGRVSRERLEPVSFVPLVRAPPA